MSGRADTILSVSSVVLFSILVCILGFAGGGDACAHVARRSHQLHADIRRRGTKSTICHCRSIGEPHRIPTDLPQESGTDSLLRRSTSCKISKRRYQIKDFLFQIPWGLPSDSVGHPHEYYTCSWSRRSTACRSWKMRCARATQ